MHEIVTLQLGHRANFVATHFWNTQESYFTYRSDEPPSNVDHDVLFRPGLNSKGEETFTPRTLIYDLKGGFGGLRKWGGLYDQELSLEQGLNDASSNGVWNGKVALQQEAQIPPSIYQQSLEQDAQPPVDLTAETVRYWSDFNRVYFHPRSIVQLSEHDLNSSVLPFDKYETGEDVFQNLNKEEDIVDRDVRLFAEECDLMQGFQVLASNYDAWGGFASRYIEALRDDFGKIPIWTWSSGETHNEGSRAAQALRSLNTAKMVSDLATLDSFHVPISVNASALPRDIQLNEGSPWYTSGLLSAALESMTLPTRLKADDRRQGRLSDFEAALNTNGNQRLAQLHFAASAPDSISRAAKPSQSFDDRVQGNQGSATATWYDDADEDQKLGVDLTGLPYDSRRSGHFLKSTKSFATVQSLRGFLDQTDPEEDQVNLVRKRRRFNGQSVVEKYHIDIRYPILDSFPPIFQEASDGQVNAIASLCTSSACMRRLLVLKQRSALVASASEREALSNSLAELSESYKEGWDSDDEPDSDD